MVGRELLVVFSCCGAWPLCEGCEVEEASGEVESGLGMVVGMMEWSSWSSIEWGGEDRVV